MRPPDDIGGYDLLPEGLEAPHYAPDAGICSVRGCDAEAFIDAEIEAEGQEYTIHLCRRHVHLAMGGAIFMEFLKEWGE